MNNKKIQQITNALCLLARINEGDALVPLLGCGNEKSNYEAIANWVSRNEDILEIESPRDQLEKFVLRLASELDEFCYMVDYCH